MINPGSRLSSPAGRVSPRKVVAIAVRWYARYGLSYRDVEEMLAERGRRDALERDAGGGTDCGAAARAW